MYHVSIMCVSMTSDIMSDTTSRLIPQSFVSAVIIVSLTAKLTFSIHCDTRMVTKDGARVGIRMWWWLAEGSGCSVGPIGIRRPRVGDG